MFFSNSRTRAQKSCARTFAHRSMSIPTVAASGSTAKSKFDVEQFAGGSDKSSERDTARENKFWYGNAHSRLLTELSESFSWSENSGSSQGDV